MLSLQIACSGAWLALAANSDYLLGGPALSRIASSSFPLGYVDHRITMSDMQLFSYIACFLPLAATISMFENETRTGTNSVLSGRAGDQLGAKGQARIGKD